MSPVLVIGAGVHGLTCGVVLAEAGRDVLIRTAERPRETTSAVAGAMWGPARLKPPERVLYWATLSHAEFTALARDESSGVHLASGRMAARFDLGDVVPPETKLIPDLQRCGEQELPDGFVWGYRGTVPLIDMPRYLDHLLERFQAAGGEIRLSPVQSLADAAAESDVVVNCTGVGAHELVGDPGVHPLFGQHVVVRNPGIDEYFIELSDGGEFTSWMPHGDRLVLGGISLDHDWRRRPRPEISDGILRRAARLEPRLADVEVLEETVGLRPGRDSVRVCTEDYEGARIIHDYGHAGCGVGLSWGCAFEVADLIEGSG
ncbi:FAD-dependent oxidoreductase [Saccharopolyspora sp. TS4A08]|uniref:D-amino-acid oxidase n=1 Tax=Saccharopolyspora ipomoeae TaxID=3042027 RepID=A0ABT6PX39_9PSEU|nr:FAD-dependent oxidoreductase [Saccharopolyspora sp. TS4A08]MDI2032563.1 FAD-dependent oxidoreductase [Saccharopolyspora sp. TS4A08]